MKGHREKRPVSPVREEDLRWITLPCIVPGCGREARIREDEDPAEAAVCLRCWAWYDSVEHAAECIAAERAPTAPCTQPDLFEKEVT